jgi:hypothetical protein
MRTRVGTVIGFLLVGGSLFVGQVVAADRLILRNLDVVAERTVLSLDEDGVVLDGPRGSGGNRVTWDEIERGRVALDQAKFDQFLAELGGPLYRIRQRLRNGDYAAASEPAELLYPRFAELKSQTAYLVSQATMWSRLANGKREAAVEPYLRCFELLRTRAAVSGSLPGARRLNTDAATAMSVELAPVWFDAAAAKEELPKVQQVVRSLSQPRLEGVYVYYASLAVAAGEFSEAERVLPQLAMGEMVWWRKLIEAQQELATGAFQSVYQRLSESKEEWPRACRPMGLLLMGLAGVQSEDEVEVRSGLLALLTLPASFAAEQPELAAAGLYHAAIALDKLKDGRGAAAVRRELTTRFPGTHFGRLGGANHHK